MISKHLSVHLPKKKHLSVPYSLSLRNDLEIWAKYLFVKEHLLNLICSAYRILHFVISPEMILTWTIVCPLIIIVRAMGLICSYYPITNK